MRKDKSFETTNFFVCEYYEPKSIPRTCNKLSHSIPAQEHSSTPVSQLNADNEKNLSGN